jgi:hypothetical protein
VVFVATLGRRLQLIVPSENVLPPFFSERLCWAEVLDKAWCVDDSAQPRRIAQDVRPNGCELIFTRAPATGREETFAAGFNCGGTLNRRQVLKAEKFLTHSEESGEERLSESP